MPDEKIFIYKQKISELIAKYLFCLDAKNLGTKEAARIFTEDARVKLPSAKFAHGCEEISGLHVAFLSQFESTHHMPGIVVCEFKSDVEAKARCALSVWHRYNAPMRAQKGAEFLILRSFLECSARCVNDEWRISELMIKNIYRKDNA